MGSIGQAQSKNDCNLILSWELLKIDNYFKLKMTNPGDYQHPTFLSLATFNAEYDIIKAL